MKLLFDNFDLLAESPGGIKKLREMILQFAVQGKLVPQDSNDEPASVLLEKIRVEKERLVKEGKIKKQKPLEPIKDGDIPFELPEGWEWLKLGCLIELVSGQHLNPNEYTNKPEGMPYFTGPADFGKKTPSPTRWTRVNKAIAIKGAGIGKLNVIENSDSAISRQLMAIRPILVNSEYMYLFLQTNYKSFQDLGVGIAIPGIGRKDVLNKQFSLPPILEQKRIVAKVDSLMALCDRLGENLSDKEKMSGKMLNPVVSRL